MKLKDLMTKLLSMKEDEQERIGQNMRKYVVLNHNLKNLASKVFYYLQPSA